MSAVIEAIRTRPTYTMAQAARLANTKPHNVRNWLYGSKTEGHSMEPVLGARAKAPDLHRVSFLDLAELIVVARYRGGSGAKMPIRRLRAAHEYACERMGIAYPFASGRFKVAGGHIIHEFDESHPGDAIAIDINGQHVLPMEFNDALELFEFDDSTQELACRWYPAGRSVPIVIEPGFGGGWPVIAGRNVRASVLVARWKSGMTIDEIADDFELPSDVVEKAINAGVVAAA